MNLWPYILVALIILTVFIFMKKNTLHEVWFSYTNSYIKSCSDPDSEKIPKIAAPWVHQITAIPGANTNNYTLRLIILEKITINEIYVIGDGIRTQLSPQYVGLDGENSVYEYNVNNIPYISTIEIISEDLASQTTPVLAYIEILDYYTIVQQTSKHLEPFRQNIIHFPITLQKLPEREWKSKYENPKQFQDYLESIAY